VRWTIVLPLKGGTTAKSRLGADPAVARAVAADTLEAVIACRAVSRTIVVTPHSRTAVESARAGAVVIGESRPGQGLVAAVRDGIAAAGAGPVGVLLGDLPALRSEDLAAGLVAVDDVLGTRPAPVMAVVPDATGTGTVLLAARTGAGLDPAFGPDSLTAHVRRGAVRVDLDIPRLRRDVDTPADLAAALELGVGPRTARTVARALRDRARLSLPGAGDRAPVQPGYP
jgi:2-phospho-L-lactate guanylyltransferase